jgi:predicted anti-sigma-YlaC factor YlaD
VFRHRHFTGSLLACLFLAMQAFWFVHGLEHDLGIADDDEAGCEFCLAMQGMGAALSGAQRHPVAVVFAAVAPAVDACIVRGDVDPVQPRQQGPPRFS